MEEFNAPVICREVFERREMSERLTPDLEAHVLSCPDCQASDEMKQLLRVYQTPGMPFYSIPALWQKVSRPKSRPTSPFGKYLIAATLLLFIAVGILLRHQASVKSPSQIAQIQLAAPKAVVARVDGEATFRQGPAGTWTNLLKGSLLTRGSQVRVGPAGKVQILFPGETSVQLAQETELLLPEISASKKGQDHILLYYGRVVVHHRQSALLAETPHATIEPIGTVFSLSYLDEDTQVRVFDGEVKVKGKQGEARVRRSEHLSFRSSRPFTIRRFSVQHPQEWEREPLLWESRRPRVLGKPKLVPMEQLRGAPEEHAARMNQIEIKRSQDLLNRAQLHEKNTTRKIEYKIDSIRNQQDEKQEKQATDLERQMNEHDTQVKQHAKQ